MSPERLMGFMWGTAFGLLIGGAVLLREPFFLFLATIPAGGCYLFGRKPIGPTNHH